MNFERRVESLKKKTDLLGKFLEVVSSTLEPPTIVVAGQLQGFRFKNPEIKHFCILKAIRAVSAFNASLELCRAGYTQEICVLLRTIIECTSHIEFVLGNEVIAPEAQKFVADFFADMERGSGVLFKKNALRQGAIHDLVGAELDKVAKATDSERYKNIVASKLYSSVYLNLSNYVHCKYPEIMDLFGGWPGKFHLKGMRHTPKDAENLELLETYFVSVSQSLQLIALRLNFTDLALSDPELADWLRLKA